ncbi:MAG: type II toxin-antitoxin system prevent-host-death family antitoxin [Chthoniobacterales bacterium]|nr:type II toxin-antitoxin system prevent-host-death family antitoxin [Chthoniobacterales bacterium]
MQTISTHEAKTHLSRYLAAVETGEEIIIARGRKLIARLVPYATDLAQKRPKVGQTLGPKFDIPDAAFAPLSEEELKEWGL